MPSLRLMLAVLRYFCRQIQPVSFTNFWRPIDQREQYVLSMTITFVSVDCLLFW